MNLIKKKRFINKLILKLNSKMINKFKFVEIKLKI